MTGLLQRLRVAASVVWKGGLPASWFDHASSLGGANPSTLARPYAESVWVMRAIKKIASPIAAVPLKFTADGETDYDDPRLLQFWEQPARGLTRHDFIEASVGWLKLAGETFWLMDDSTLRPFPEVASYTPLIMARPDRMRERVERNQLVGWEYRDAGHQLHLLLPEQVEQPKFWNPYNDWRGLAEYSAARVATEADHAAGEYQRNLMMNNGDTGPIISATSGIITDEQQRQIITQLRMKQEYARRGEFRAAFLTSDVNVQNPTAQTVDAAFAAMRLGNRHEIFLAFGVPPSMADKMESYSIGSASDWFMLISETCIPTSEKLAASISNVVRRQTGLELTAYFDWDEHPVMQAVRRERMEAAERLWSKGMSMQAINDYLQLGMEPFPGWETGYLPFSVTPIGESGLPEAEPVETADEFAEPVNEALRALRARVAVTPQAECGGCALDLSDLEIKAGDSADARLWKSQMQKRRESLRGYESKFNAALMVARREVLRKLAAAEIKQLSAPQTRAAAADFMFDLNDFTKLFQFNMRQAGLNALQAAGEQVLAELGLDDPWKMPQAETLEFLAARENRLSKVPDDVFERIRDQISEGLTEGDSLKDIAGRVRAEFNEISDGRAKTIAHTETAAAYGKGRNTAMRQSGVKFKRWLTSNNNNVRAAHKLMNRTIVPFTEPFVVYNPKTGETDEIQFPADSSGAPWNVINCHCVALASAKGPEGDAEPSA